MSHTNFDVAALRSLVAGIDLGSFAKAADRVARSSSAVSAQIRKLEEQAGAPLFRKAGRGLALTDAGEAMLRYARRLIELNDEAAAAVRGAALDGWVRIGLQEDFGEALLPDLLGRFARAHSKVRVEARVARNAELLERLAAGQIDLALVWGDPAASTAAARAGIDTEIIAQVPMGWVGAAEPAAMAGAAAWRESGEPFPLVAFDQPCTFFTAATGALDRAGVRWRIVFTSPSLAGLWAAAAAGLGITVRSPYGLPASVRLLDPRAHGLPVLPSLPLVLLARRAAGTPAVEELMRIVRQSVGGAAEVPLSSLAA